MENSKLAQKATVGLLRVAAVMVLVLFLPVPGFSFWQGWIYLGVTLSALFLITGYLWKYDPSLLKNRINISEVEPGQRIFQIVAGLGFLTMLFISALDYRLGLSSPAGVLVEIVGLALVITGYLLIFFVFRANSFAAATITISKEQTVVSSGPYRSVRHPMYSGISLIVVGTPMVLGSWWAMLGIFPVVVPLIWRLLAEERFLINNLQGYEAYCLNTRYRLLPLIW